MHGPPLRQPDVTDLLHRWQDGDAQALEELTPLVYLELHRIAGRHVAGEHRTTMVSHARSHRSPLSCPVCKRPLAKEGTTYVCDATHTFDVAKEGYVNLILAQHMRSRLPGDNVAMVDARARFLAAGHYRPVGEALIRAIADNLPTARSSVLLDAGCGEGYYLRLFMQSTKDAQLATLVDTYGFDVSRYAIRRAARQDPRSTYVVASNHRLPLQERSTDLLLSHFSPVDPDEFTRVLAPDGTIVLGLPGPDHLFGLKELVYSTPLPHPQADPLASCRSVSLIDSRRVRFDITITGAQHVADVLAMTPFYWSASATIQDSLKERNSLETPIDIVINTYRMGPAS